jgi:hypothetical protein
LKRPAKSRPLKDNINEMIVNLRDTTEKNTAQDWLKTNLAKFTRLLQGQRDLATVSRTILSELAPLVPMQHGVIYFNESATEEPDLRLLASYAYTEGEQLKTRFRAGEGLVGQAAVEKKRFCSPTSRPTTSRSVRAWARRRRPTSSSSRSCSKARSRRSSSWPRSTASTKRT